MAEGKGQETMSSLWEKWGENPVPGAFIRNFVSLDGLANNPIEIDKASSMDRLFKFDKKMKLLMDLRFLTSMGKLGSEAAIKSFLKLNRIIKAEKFQRAFLSWLKFLPASSEDVINTPWLKDNLTDIVSKKYQRPDFSMKIHKGEILSKFKGLYMERSAFEQDLKLMQSEHFFPSTLKEAYIYYKYIVKGFGKYPTLIDHVIHYDGGNLDEWFEDARVLEDYNTNPLALIIFPKLIGERLDADYGTLTSMKSDKRKQYLDHLKKTLGHELTEEELAELQKRKKAAEQDERKKAAEQAKRQKLELKKKPLEQEREAELKKLEQEKEAEQKRIKAEYASSKEEMKAMHADETVKLNDEHEKELDNIHTMQYADEKKQSLIDKENERYKSKTDELLAKQLLSNDQFQSKFEDILKNILTAKQREMEKINSDYAERIVLATAAEQKLKKPQKRREAIELLKPLVQRILRDMKNKPMELTETDMDIITRYEKATNIPVKLEKLIPPHPGDANYDTKRKFYNKHKR